MIEANRKMAGHEFGRTCAAHEMKSRLEASGFKVDDHHEKLYRNTMVFVAATKVSA